MIALRNMRLKTWNTKSQSASVRIGNSNPGFLVNGIFHKLDGLFGCKFVSFLSSVTAGLLF